MRIFKWYVDPRLLWGSLLIVGGVLFLLQNLNLLPGGAIFWGGILAAAGLLFLATAVGDRNQWWALIPGLTLLSLSVTVFVSTFAPPAWARFSDPLVLAGLGLSFWLIYLFHQEHWWAVIPGGVLLTLAGVAWLPLLRPEVRGMETGGFFSWDWGRPSCFWDSCPLPRAACGGLTFQAPFWPSWGSCCCWRLGRYSTWWARRC